MPNARRAEREETVSKQVYIDLDELARQYGLQVLTGAWMELEDEDGCYHKLGLEDALTDDCGVEH